ncbi:hypothetical protein [uncultured Cetobacterium sp.]|uniref:hypothetical protein n=1 Tax=uncultured Cetobacterium sp. TaxID=527638 RepID=UPI002636A46E|nr:hypothetical protein [uncultured Cetobacterium sp.]
MKDKYNKIKKYLEDYNMGSNDNKEYLLDLHGISSFYIQVKKLLKENNLEEKYEFFGKILVNIDEFTKDTKVGSFIKNKINFFPIKSKDDLDYFINNILNNSCINESDDILLQNLLEKFNQNFSNFFEKEKPPFLREHLTLIFNPYNPQECFDIILKLESLIKPFFDNRDKENQIFKDIGTVANLLNKITGIDHNKKGKFEKETNKKEINKKWKKNIDSLGLKK